MRFRISAALAAILTVLPIAITAHADCTGALQTEMNALDELTENSNCSVTDQINFEKHKNRAIALLTYCPQSDSSESAAQISTMMLSCQGGDASALSNSAPPTTDDSPGSSGGSAVSNAYSGGGGAGAGAVQ